MKTYETLAGDEITNTITQAISAASEHDDMVVFDFNGVNVVVESDSDALLIYRDWHRGLKGYLGDSPTVGPHPTSILSDDEKASDAKIASVNEERRQLRQAEYEKKQAAKTELLKSILSNAGPIELSDEKKWNDIKAANTDPYGGRCVRYAEEWARLMQVRIANGETVAECVDETSHIADDDGITGFMHDSALSILCECWKHGPELDQWRVRISR